MTRIIVVGNGMVGISSVRNYVTGRRMLKYQCTEGATTGVRPGSPEQLFFGLDSGRFVDGPGFLVCRQ
jgi:GTP-binding protein EngB required for normal cell division